MPSVRIAAVRLAFRQPFPRGTFPASRPVRDAGQGLERGPSRCSHTVRYSSCSCSRDQRTRLADLANCTHRGKTNGRIRIDDPADQNGPRPGWRAAVRTTGSRKTHRVVRGVRERVNQFVGHARRRSVASSPHPTRTNDIAAQRRPVVGKRAHEVGRSAVRAAPPIDWSDIGSIQMRLPRWRRARVADSSTCGDGCHRWRRRGCRARDR